MSSIGTLTRREFTSSRSFKYVYHDSAPGVYTHHTNLFLHGFPDNEHAWRMIKPYLDDDNPNRIIALDQNLPLGADCKEPPVGEKDDEHDVKDRRAFQDLAADMAELLAAENINRVDVAGYDWGTLNAQKVLTWRPELVQGVGALSVVLSKRSAKTKPAPAPSARPWGSILTADAPATVDETKQQQTFRVQRVYLPDVEKSVDLPRVEMSSCCLLSRRVRAAWKSVCADARRWWRVGGPTTTKA